MSPFKAGVLYFALVFGAGFVLGIMRTLWVAPRLGTRNAELVETPVMLFISFISAGWIFRFAGVPYTVSSRLSMGCFALALMLVAEFTLVRWLRGLSVREYLATRDPVSGTVYYMSLGVFAIMPFIVGQILSV